MIYDIYVRFVLWIAYRLLKVFLLVGIVLSVVHSSIVYAAEGEILENTIVINNNIEKLEELKARLNGWRYVNQPEDLLWTGSSFLLREAIQENLGGTVLLEVPMYAGRGIDSVLLEERKESGQRIIHQKHILILRKRLHVKA